MNAALKPCIIWPPLLGKRSSRSVSISTILSAYSTTSLVGAFCGLFCFVVLAVLVALAVLFVPLFFSTIGYYYTAPQTICQAFCLKKFLVAKINALYFNLKTIR